MCSPTKQQLEKLVKSGDPTSLLKVKEYLELLEADNLKTSFKAFVKKFWPLVSTSPLQEGWYLDCLCDHLQALPRLKRLLVNIPPRHGKSTLFAVLFPAWFWLQKPQTKFLCSSYSLKDLSIRDSIACRAVVESPVYQRFFGHSFKLSADQNTKNRFTNDKLGLRLATSTESGNTGEGADVIICDDLNNVAKADSHADRQSVIQWWTQTLSTRSNPGGLDCKVVIQQRCHEEDITGHILKNDTEAVWTHLILPWEYDPARRTVTSVPWADPRQEVGEPLSNLLTKEKIVELKGGNGLGPTGFATQFNQRPAPAEGAVFKREWFLHYEDYDEFYMLGEVKVPKELCHTVITTDLAISLNTGADFTVALTGRITPHNHLLVVDLWRDRVEGPDAIKAFKRLCSRWKPDALYVEEVAFQIIMLQLLRQAGLPVRGLKPHGMGDKKARAQRVMVKAECGQVWLPRSALWLSDYLAELTTFPNAAHDDMVDCTAWLGIVAAKYPVGEIPEQVVIDKEERLRRREAELLVG